MRTQLCLSRAGLSTALLLSVAASAQAAVTIINLGGLPGATYNCTARGISADGTVVTGSSTMPIGYRAFRWTSAGGMVDLGTLGGGTSKAYAISGDGTCVGGNSDINTTTFHAFRWTSSGGQQDLGVLPGGTTSTTMGISYDGSVVTGDSRLTGTGNTHAFRWTAAGGMQDLGVIIGGNGQSHGQAISGDGAVIVGYGHIVGGDRAFRWTAAGGMQSLGVLPGGTASRAFGVNADGSVVTGYSNIGTGISYAFRWTSATGMVNLGLIPGSAAVGAGTSAGAMNSDGTVILGSGMVGPVPHATLWTEALGMVDLNTYLPSLGVDLSAWTLLGATGVSADGSTIAGYGTFGGETRPFLITGLPVPHPCGTADFNGDGDTGTDADIEAFFACLAGNCCATCFSGGADFNNDGDVGTDADIEAFFRVLAGNAC